MTVDRKHMKIGVAALAASALIIGLSVGLTQKTRSNKSSQLAASSGYRMSDCIYVETEVDTYYSKGGKCKFSSQSTTHCICRFHNLLSHIYLSFICPHCPPFVITTLLNLMYYQHDASPPSYVD